MKTYAMMVLGCKVNDYEATFVREKMNQHYEEIDFKSVADIYIIFTCAVTNTAESKTRKFFHEARRRNPDAYIVAVGCLSQIKGNTDDFKDIDLIIGSDRKDEIVDLILAHDTGYKVNENISKEFEDMFIEKYPTKSRSFLKIQDGCNQFCSYCVIPYTRGRERCANHLNIIEEAKVLAKTNKEIVLTGIHTGRYNDGEFNLFQLLCELVKIEDLKAIRLSSIEITEITDEIIELMANNPKLSPHLHIPSQTCDNTILKNMNRPYTIEEYKDRIGYIRSKVKDVSISTDLIVGFPGETEELFENTYENLKEIEFSFIHCFPYSRKAGTKADKMSGHVDPKIKKARVKKVLELDEQLRKNYALKFIGKEADVLVEKNKDGYSYGYSRNYIYVKVKGEFPIGEYVRAVITSADNEVLADAVI